MKILLIGDIALDKFIEGECTRISPEKPVIVFCPQETHFNHGMAGNVEMNLRSLAPEAEIQTIYSKEVSVKTRYVDKVSNQHLLRVDEDKFPASFDTTGFADLLDKNNFSAVVLSSYGKGFLTTENMETILLLCHARSIPTFLDIKEVLGEWSKTATFVKINAKEYAHQVFNVKEPYRFCQNLIVTKGGAGIDLYSQNGENLYHAEGQKIEVMDQVGCGDSTIAALVIKYLENGGNIKTAMDWANKVGAIAVSKRGVVAVKREEVDE